MRLKLMKVDYLDGEFMRSPIYVDAPRGWRSVRDAEHDGACRLCDASGTCRQLVFSADESAVLAVGVCDEVVLPIIACRKPITSVS